MKTWEPLETVRIWAIMQIATRGPNAGKVGIVMTESGTNLRAPQTLKITFNRLLITGRGKYELVAFRAARTETVPPTAELRKEDNYE